MPRLQSIGGVVIGIMAVGCDCDETAGCRLLGVGGLPLTGLMLLDHLLVVGLIVASARIEDIAYYCEQLGVVWR